MLGVFMARESSQKFIGRNRPPRVQLEYDVELYGAEKKVEVPFVMGVLSDLSGASAKELPPVAERKPLEIDVDNFDARMASVKPSVDFSVDNKLTGEGRIKVEMDFEKMDDFSPASVAKSVEPLARLLETRTQLANLITYMDGKAGAETLIAKLLNDPELLKALASKSAPEAGDEDVQSTEDEGGA